MVLDSGCALSIATVYSTLELFCREGMINRMSALGRPDRFDATVENHLHLYLPDTGEILDVPDDLASLIMNSVDAGMIGIIEKQMGVQVDQVGVHLIGRREPLKDSEAT
jgi:Fe2+ or Zn2+ uptake regulation protein